LSFLPAFATPRRPAPVAALLVKELRLQDGTLVVAAVLVLLHLAALATPLYFTSWGAKYPFIENTWMLWCLAPLLVGCSSIAEERRGRTLEGSLCLPVGRMRQFVVKLLVAFGVGIFLGAVMPWLLEQLRYGENPGLFPTAERGLPWLLLTAGVITAIGFYASSLTGTLLQALATAIGVWLLSCLALALLFHNFDYMHDSGDRVAPSLVAAWSWLIATLSLPIAAILFLSYANFKQLRITWRHWLRNSAIWLSVVFGPPVLLFILNGIATLIYSWKTLHR